MKKLLALLLALAMCLAMFACGETEDKKDKNDKDEEVEAEIAELEEELEDLEAELEEAKEDEDDELIEELEEKIEKIEKKIDKLKDGDKDEDEDDEDDDKKKDDEDEEEEEEEETKKPSEKPSKNDEEAQTTAPAPETTPAPVTTDYVWWEDEPEDTYVWWEDDEPAYTEAYTTDDEWYYDEPEEDDGAASFSEALTEFKGILDIMESGDVEAYAAASGGDTSELDPMSYAVVECMLKNFEYTLGNAYEGSDTGSVEVTITNVNTMELTYALIAEVENCQTEEEMMAAMVAYLNGTVPTFTETVTVYFEKTNNGWEMDEYASQDFASVIAGMPIEE